MATANTFTESQAEVTATFLRQELSCAFMRIWETALCMPLKLADVAIADKDSLPWLGAVAWIGGNWTGNIRIGLPKELASLVTSHLLKIETPSIAQIEDALREIANMTAGNLKSSLPGRCGLATPGNFVIRSLDGIQDEFSPVMLSWYQSGQYSLFLSLSTLHPVAMK